MENAALRRSAPLVALLGALAGAPASAEQVRGQELLKECADCHQARADGGLERIVEGRRTPEGWDMTVVRMMRVHEQELKPEQRRAIVKYLADTAGLAPSEARPWRYVLERRPDATDRVDNALVGDTCGRCHSYARIALQRRTEADWLRLAHFHVGQFPSIEIQNQGRDRNWWEIASKQVPPVLGKLYPLQSEAWKQWQSRPRTAPSGTWRVVGHRAGWGDYEGVATVTERGADEYALDLELRYENGKTQKGSGTAVVYTGYEWRASLTQGEGDAQEEVREVFALSEDGKRLQGRWFLKDVDALGAELRGVKQGGAPQILSVTPSHLKAGTTRRIAIHGVGLSGEVGFGAGVRVLREVSRNADTVVVEAQASTAAAAGARSVRVGTTRGQRLLAVYRRIDYVRVEPGRGLARVGGGKLAKVPVQYEAVAYAAGRDGKRGTTDDLRIGVFPARWSFGNLNAAATAMKDADFAGRIEEGGLFVPADAGPNPRRKFSTNNSGELKVSAVVEDGRRRIKASAPLVVTVQRWVDPPIW